MRSRWLALAIALLACGGFPRPSEASGLAGPRDPAAVSVRLKACRSRLAALRRGLSHAASPVAHKEVAARIRAVRRELERLRALDGRPR